MTSTANRSAGDPDHGPSPDYPSLLDAHEQAIKSLYMLISGSTDDELSRRLPGGDWAVGDIVGHVVDVETAIDDALNNTALNDTDQAATHVNTDARIQAGVHMQRMRAYDDLLDDYRNLTKAHLRALRSLTSPSAAYYPHPYHRTPIPVDRFIAWRTASLWLHAEDIRETLGHPGDADSLASGVAVAYLHATHTVSDAALLRGAGVRHIFNLTGPSPVVTSAVD